MRSGPGSRFAAAGLALLAACAVLLQAWLSLALVRGQGGGAGQALWTLAGYFTILSNVFVALTAAAQALAPGARLAGPSVRGCATTAIVLVGIGYHLLLRQVWDPQGWQRVADDLLHYAVPAAALLHWLAFPPREPPPATAPLRWLVYPLAYFGWVLARGAWQGTYPYPFVDVPALGYARVAFNAAGLAIAFLAAGALLRWTAVRR